MRKALILALALLCGPAQAGISFPPYIPGQIVGTATNDNACTGCVGENNTATVLSGSAVPLTTGTTAIITHVDLTAGQWTIFGVCNGTGAATTTVSSIVCAWNTANDTTLPPRPALSRSDFGYASTTLFNTADQAIDIPGDTLKCAAACTVYLKINIGFAVSTASAYGKISAIRAR